MNLHNGYVAIHHSDETYSITKCKVCKGSGLMSNKILEEGEALKYVN